MPDGSGAPLFSLCQLALPLTTTAEDIEICARIGAAGLGLDVNKLGDPADDPKVIEMLQRHQVATSVCVPEVMSFLPMPDIPGPDDVDTRLRLVIDGIRRFAAFDPDSVFILTGPRLPTDTEEQSRERVLTALGAAAAAADDCGVRLALEPMRPSLRDTTTLVCSLTEGADLLDEAGTPQIGLVLDTWHQWDSPKLSDEIARYAGRIIDVQISDYRPPRTFADRFLPGDGEIDWDTLLGDLISAGYQGYYDLEVFSDDGRYGVDLPDSVWKTDTAEWTGRGQRQFASLYASAMSKVGGTA
jgi:sugar phosphate isomerase/epimerase